MKLWHQLLVYFAACRVAPPHLHTLYVRAKWLPVSHDLSDGAATLWDDLDLSMLRARSNLDFGLEVRGTAPQVQQFRAFISERLRRSVAQGRLRLVEEIEGPRD